MAVGIERLVYFRFADSLRTLRSMLGLFGVENFFEVGSRQQRAQLDVGLHIFGYLSRRSRLAGQMNAQVCEAIL